MAAKSSIDLSRRFNMSVIMSAANTFTQATVPTGLSTNDTLAMMVKHVDWEWIFAGADMPGLAADGYVIGQLTDASKTSIARIIDDDVIWRNTVMFPFTTSGAYSWSPSGQQECPDGCMIVSPNIYIAALTSGLASAATLDLRIEYELVKLSEVDYLRMLATQ
jgi:hypothetical protein